MDTDLGGAYLLVGTEFYYLGGDAVGVPPAYSLLLQGGRGHRCNFDPSIVEGFLRWLRSSYACGIHGAPALGEVVLTEPKGITVTKHKLNLFERTPPRPY